MPLGQHQMAHMTQHNKWAHKVNKWYMYHYLVNIRSKPEEPHIICFGKHLKPLSKHIMPLANIWCHWANMWCHWVNSVIPLGQHLIKMCQHLMPTEPTSDPNLKTSDAIIIISQLNLMPPCAPFNAAGRFRCHMVNIWYHLVNIWCHLAKIINHGANSSYTVGY